MSELSGSVITVKMLRKEQTDGLNLLGDVEETCNEAPLNLCLFSGH